MKTPFEGLPIGRAGNFRIILLALAIVFVIALLLYSQHITEQLLERERNIVSVYARSLEYVASSDQPSDVSFAFEVIQAIDFPIVLTDASNRQQYSKNIEHIETDTVGMTQEKKEEYFARLIAEMDRTNKPIRVAVEDTLILNYVHYGESSLIRQLRWLPVSELSIAAILLMITYIGFRYIRRSEQSNIWVGMAKETAHQLGTPLSSLMGWLERLRSDPRLDQRSADTLSEMEHDINRLNKVAARFSKIGSRPDLKTENVAAVIQDVMTYIGKRIPRSGKKVELVLDTPGDFPAAINRELFEWVIENLMKNALDAMEGATGKISFSLSRSGGRTTIDVTDTGKGIDAKFHKEVFRPGYSTKKRGWGLGLSLSKRIIEDYHKGKLAVKQSAVGAGTTFRIRLGR
jgi:signal transduction histidine kinase